MPNCSMIIFFFWVVIYRGEDIIGKNMTVRVIVAPPAPCSKRAVKKVTEITKLNLTAQVAFF